jgi:multisubunit Na+/H+ antiporter MnhB subunit
MNGGDSATGEVLRTAGLLLNFAAIVAFALFLSTLGANSPGPSGAAAAVTAVAFLASLLCFAADRRRSEEQLTVAGEL